MNSNNNLVLCDNLEDPEINSISELEVPQEVLDAKIVLPFVDTSNMTPGHFLMRHRLEAAMKGIEIEIPSEAIFNLVGFYLQAYNLKKDAEFLNNTLLGGNSTSIEFLNSSVEYFMKEIDARLDLAQGKESK